MVENTTLLNINQEKEGKEFFRIIQYLRNKFPLICASILAISCTIFTLLFNYYLGSMMNILTQPDRSKKDFQVQFLKSFIFAIFLVLLHAFNYEMRSFANSELSHDLRYSIYKQILRQDISFFDEEEHSTGILVGSYLSQDVNIVCSNYINTILNAEQDVILSIGGIIIAFFTMWQVALPVTIILIIMVFVYYYGNKYVDKLWEEYHQHSTQSISKVEEVLTSFRTVKSFNNEIYETQRYGQSLNSIQKVIDRISFFKGIKDSIINCLSNFITAFFIYFACYLIVKKASSGI